jgi:hypothetical protein
MLVRVIVLVVVGQAQVGLLTVGVEGHVLAPVQVVGGGPASFWHLSLPIP